LAFGLDFRLGAYPKICSFIDCQKDNASVSGAMLSPLLTEHSEPEGNTAKACSPLRVQHAFEVFWALWRNSAGASKAWHPARIIFLRVNSRRACSPLEQTAASKLTG
jgi:hypothetical protein